MSLEQRRTIHFLMNFEVMDCREVTKLWREGGCHLAACIGRRFCSFHLYGLIFISNTYLFYVDQIAKTSAKERMERWERIKYASSGVNNPKSHPRGLTIRGQKRALETSPLVLIEAKAQTVGDEPSSSAGQVAEPAVDAKFMP